MQREINADSNYKIFALIVNSSHVLERVYYYLNSKTARERILERIQGGTQTPQGLLEENEPSPVIQPSSQQQHLFIYT
jgi:hypothetical protein